MSSIKNIILKNVKIPNSVKLLIITLAVVGITVGLVYALKSRDNKSCNLPECNPCLYNYSELWGSCEKDGFQRRIATPNGHIKTDMTTDELKQSCTIYSEKRNCKYINTGIFFYNNVDIGWVFAAEFKSDKSFITIPENKRNDIKKIVINNIPDLTGIGVLVLESIDNKFIKTTSTSFTIPDNFILKQVTLSQQ